MKNTKNLVLTSLIAATYVVLTLINPISCGMLQFRISEIVAILPFYDKRFIPGGLLGVAIANAFSPLGIIDVVFGLGIALIAYFIINQCSNLYVKLILYALLCGLLVGVELYIVSGISILLSFISISLSMLIICFLGIPIDRWLIKMINKQGW